MSTQFKPEGYNSVQPYFVVDGAQKLINLLKQIFSVEEKRRFDRPDGKIMHCEIQIDDSIVMIADSTDQYPPNQHMLHVYVPDVDETFKKAMDSGCELIEEPVQKEGEQDRRGVFKDFAGNMWAVATQL